MGEEKTMPHKLLLTERKTLTLSGVTEVLSFDENAVLLKTDLGRLSIHGKLLQLKNLSPDGGQVALEGQINAILYEQPRASGGLRRLLR